MKVILQSLRVAVLFTLLTGLLYPLLVTGLGRIGFPTQATGSIGRNGTPLLAQKTESPEHFWPRPSAADFATVASGASNHGPTNASLAKAIAERREKLGKDAPDELLTASGSGLDPHLSPAAARYQAARVAAARRLPREKVDALIEQHTEGPQLGFLGEARVNVLVLNQALEALR